MPATVVRRGVMPAAVVRRGAMPAGPEKCSNKCEQCSNLSRGRAHHGITLLEQSSQHKGARLNRVCAELNG